MLRPRQTRVLAVCIDSAESTLVRELIEGGELPALGGLLESGGWARVDAHGSIGSGAIWPTFITGTPPSEHGISTIWLWNPESMSCTSLFDGFDHDPFWRPLVEAGESVGLMDVPFSNPSGIDRGFDVVEWAPHYRLLDKMHVTPVAASALVAEVGPNPIATLTPIPGRYEQPEARQALASACAAGTRMRGDLAVRLISETTPALSIIVFNEFHHAMHPLWNTLPRDREVFTEPRFRDPEVMSPDIVELHRETDRQLARIIEAAGEETAVMVFSLHGAKASAGMPVFLPSLLKALGFAEPLRWNEASWRARGTTLYAGAKRRMPAFLRNLYNRAASEGVRHRLARSTMVPPHDWSRTRAFALPTDQHGLIRINLRGREAQGIVAESDYGAVCDQVEEGLRAIETPEGVPLVDRVIRSSEETGRPPERLPDLIVHWTLGAWPGAVLTPAGPMTVDREAASTDRTGEHSHQGFCVADRRILGTGLPEEIAGDDLHRLLLAPLEVGTT